MIDMYFEAIGNFITSTHLKNIYEETPEVYRILVRCYYQSEEVRARIINSFSEELKSRLERLGVIVLNNGIYELTEGALQSIKINQRES